MMLSRRNVILLVAVVVAAGLGYYATVAFADPPERRHGRGRGRGRDGEPCEQGGRRGGEDRGPRDAATMMGRWLKLDESQVEKIRDADPKFHAEMRTLRRRLEIERLKLANLLESEDASEVAILAQFEKVGQAHMAMHNRLGKHVVAVRPHLSVDQRAAFLRLIARRMRGGPGEAGGRGAGRDGHFGPHHGPPPRRRPGGPRGRMPRRPGRDERDGDDRHDGGRPPRRGDSNRGDRGDEPRELHADGPLGEF
jgi:Spy/CpxP family protein refolding chaperone